MFSQESKLAVLESKLSIYEDLSREMLTKLESAVDKISEGNSRIATILAKHDERIEQSIKTDELIIKMIEDFRGQNKEDYNNIIKRMEILEKTVEDLKKFKWQFGGVLAVLVVLIAVFNSFIPSFIPPIQPTNIVIDENK